MIEFKLELLPPSRDLETKAVLRQLNRANKALAQLKGYSETIPNKNILINAITLNEAKDSSEIENIVTTHDELYKAMVVEGQNNSPAKEVVNYRRALWYGYEFIKENGIITTNLLIQLQQLIEQNNAGIRRLPGTSLRNDRTGEIVYTPPSSEQEILKFMSNLETYINEDYDGLDPLIKLAIIHFQFECIHPFYDGNGRTGRILNVLYLVLKDLTDSPILYLSKFIINNKQGYYRFIREVQTEGNWEGWILYILEAIEQTSEETLKLIKTIRSEMEQAIEEIRIKATKIYSKELVEAIFFELYTKNIYIQETLGIDRKTATKYLKQLVEIGILKSEKIGKEVIYLNERLLNILK